MLQDLKSAFRELRKNPWFTCVAVLTLALGIGACTAIFGVVNRLLLSPFPYPAAERLVQLRLGRPSQEYGYPTWDYIARAWREGTRSLEGIEAYSIHDLLAYDDRGARLVHGMNITPGLPGFLGVTPVLGRPFFPDDAAPGAPAVVLLSYATWQRDYGGTHDVLGRALTLDDVPHVVIGVMPPAWDAISSTSGYSGGDVWLPLSLDAATVAQPGLRAVEVVARVRPGVVLADVGSELDALAKTAQQAAPASTPQLGSDFVTRATRPADVFVDANTRAALRILLGAVALVLLVACSNVANLLLARGASRGRELALRTALGASGWRLTRALLTECVLLAIAACAFGLGVGWLALRVLVELRPSNLTALGDVHLDPVVLAFAVGVSAATVLFCGLAPALQLVYPKLGSALRQGAAGVVRAGSGARVRKLLVATQMAISVMLLVGAGLLTRSVVYLQHVDVGFDPRNLFSVELSLPRARYQTPTSLDAFADDLIERVRTIPGVAAVSQAFTAPPHLVITSGLQIRGVTLSDADARAGYAFNYVRPDYFQTLGIRVLEGRTFTSDERRSGSALVINKAAARQFFPDTSAIGAEVNLQRDWTTVVGVVDDVATGGLRGRRDAPIFYWPFTAEHTPTFFGATPSVTLVVRSASDPAMVMGSIRAAARALDPEVAIPSMLLTETALAQSIDVPRFNMALLSAFAAIALALAAVGLAAVIGYEVAERTHEIGIRVALGARSRDVRRIAMRHGMVPAAAGVLCGVLGALAAAQLMSGLLYGIPPRDPLTFVGVVGVLLVVAFAASSLPAQRATRVDPIVALRAD